MGQLDAEMVYTCLYHRHLYESIAVRFLAPLNAMPNATLSCIDSLVGLDISAQLRLQQADLSIMGRFGGWDTTTTTGPDD